MKPSLPTPTFCIIDHKFKRHCEERSLRRSNLLPKGRDCFAKYARNDMNDIMDTIYEDSHG